MQELYDEINEQELLEMVAEAVKIPSMNPPGNEYGMCKYIEDILSANDIEYTKVEIEPNRYDILAKLNGKTSNDAIVFTGHMDVVSVSDDEVNRWSLDPFSGAIKSGYLYGRGSTDMKGGLLCAVYAMVLFKRNHIIPAHDIILAATVDEENYMKGSSALIGHEIFKNAKYLIVCEPTGLSICNQQKGRTWANVKVNGKTAHGSQRGTGENAIYMAIKLIELIKNTDFDEYTDSFWRVLAINAGVEPQVVPDSCVFTVDARLQVGHEPDDVWKCLDELIAYLNSRNKDLNVEYEVIDKRDSWHTDKNDEIIKNIEASLSGVGERTELDIFQGSTDASKLMKNGLIPVIIGPGDLSKAHRENECVKISQLYKACRIYMSIMNT